MRMIRVILVEDEKNAMDALEIKLRENFSDVQVVATCNSGAAAIKQIETLKPELVFLDINLPDLDGFSILEKVQSNHFKIIFTTAYDEYAVKAFRYNALDYLLKPVGLSQLKEAIDRYRQQSDADSTIHQIKYFLQNINNTTHGINKLAIPTLRGLKFIDISSIIRLESENNYTIFYLNNQPKLVASKTLGDYEDLLDANQFVRIHQSHIINLACLKEYLRVDGGTVVMTDGMELEISKRRKEHFKEMLNNFLKR